MSVTTTSTPAMEGGSSGEHMLIPASLQAQQHHFPDVFMFHGAEWPQGKALGSGCCSDAPLEVGISGSTPLPGWCLKSWDSPLSPHVLRAWKNVWSFCFVFFFFPSLQIYTKLPYFLSVSSLWSVVLSSQLLLL